MVKPVVSTILGLTWLVLAAGVAGGGTTPYVPDASPGISTPAPLPPEPAAARQPQPSRQHRHATRRNTEPIILFTLR